METFILFYYLTTWSASAGMATATAEFPTKTACNSAGIEVAKQFAGVYTRVYWFCQPKQQQQQAVKAPVGK
jgi:hypothetical protein